MGFCGFDRTPGGRHPLSVTGGGDERGRGIGRLWPLFVGVPLIALLAVGAIVLSGGGGEDPPASPGDRPQTQKEPAGEGRTAKLGTPTLGSADAPVVLTEYSDYQ